LTTLPLFRLVEIDAGEIFRARLWMVSNRRCDLRERHRVIMAPSPASVMFRF
jgi:hypothetical protein